MIKLYSALFVFTFIPIILCGQRELSLQKDFAEKKVPQTNSDEWYLSNRALDVYNVSADGGKLIIKKSKEVNHCGLKTPGGTFIGINDGEFGGSLYFNTLDSTKKPVFIKSGNIKFIFRYKSKIYFIESLAHKSLSYGALYELDKKEDKFIYKKLLEFDDAPEAFTIYNNNILIATHSGFCIIRNFKKEVVVINTFWKNLYPNSVAAINNKNIFIGIRGGIVNLNPVNKEIRFYKKKE
jgi:hypothetical protein